MTKNLKYKGHPWDDNLPRNKKYIKKFYKKTEQQIKMQEDEGKAGK